jgi:adenylate kinase family enzyme
MKMLPPDARCVLVFGQSGSGKTTVGCAIARSLCVPAIELDALYHQPNWQPTPDDEFRAKVTSLLEVHLDGWVVEGNYRIIREITMPRADAIVRLRLPFRVVYWRLWKRTLTRAWRREELWNGNRESFRLSFTSRDSILLWGISHWRAHTRSLDAALREIPHTAPVIELRSCREVDEFLASLPSSDARAPSRDSSLTP